MFKRQLTMDTEGFVEVQLSIIPKEWPKQKAK